MPLPRKTNLPDAPKVNVWNIETKTIAFTGNAQDAALFMGVTTRTVVSVLARKGRVGHKWAVRAVKAGI